MKITIDIPVEEVIALQNNFMDKNVTAVNDALGNINKTILEGIVKASTPDFYQKMAEMWKINGK